MSDLRTTISDAGWRRIGSVIVVLAFMAVLLAMLRKPLAFVVALWFDSALGLFDESHAIAAHRIHDFAFSLIFWTATIGMLVQLRRPRQNIAGQIMALIPWVGLLLAFALTDFWEPLPVIAIFGGLSLLAAVVHPSGRALLRSFEVAGTNRILLALVIVATVPLLAFAAIQVGLQTGEIVPSHDHGGEGHDHEEVHQEHIDAGHFALMAAFTFVVIGTGLLASLQPTGWWLPAWLTGVLPVFIGLASLVFPEAASSLDQLWGFAAVLWGVVFVAAAEFTQDPDSPTLLGRLSHG